jgi:hypothetical protein
MGESHLTCSIGWSDPDVVEITVSVFFDGWGGTERAFAGRQELSDFASALESVAEGGTNAELAGGQQELSYVRLKIFEYGRARRLGFEIEFGRASGTVTGLPSSERRLQFAVPVERGQLTAFAGSLRTIIHRDQGMARISLPSEWPF